MYVLEMKEQSVRVKQNNPVNMCAWIVGVVGSCKKDPE